MATNLPKQQAPEPKRSVIRWLLVGGTGWHGGVR